MSWWSRRTACGHTLLVIHLVHQNMLFGTNLQNPSRTMTHSPLFSVFTPAVQITHADGLKNIPSAVKKPSTIRCCFPCRTCDNGWKSTDALWDKRSAPNSFVRWCYYVCAHALSSGSEVREEERDCWSELHGAGWDLGHSQDFLLGCGCSLTHNPKISYAVTAKLNRRKQTTQPQIM